MHGQQGVPAQLEEVLVNTDGFHVEQFGPQGHQVPLQLGARGIDLAKRGAAAGSCAQRREDLFRRPQVVRYARVSGPDGRGCRRRRLGSGEAGRLRRPGVVPHLRGVGGTEAERAATGRRAERFQEEKRGAIALRGHERDLHRLQAAIQRNLAQTRHHAVFHAAPQRPAAEQERVHL